MAETCWIVAVVSRATQEESLPEQERDLRARAVENGWDVTRTFAEDSTGKHGPRRLIRDMVAQLRALPPEARPGIIVMNRLDRVGRGRIVDSQLVLAELGDLGVRVWTREQGFVANETWTDELINAVRFAVARQENEARADRSRAGRQRRRQAGLHVSGNAPYGCLIIEGRAVAYEPEAGFVRDLFEKRQQRWGYDRLARHAAQNAPPKRLTDGRLKRYRWGRSTIARLFTVETLRGLVVPEQLYDDVRAMRGTSWSTREARTPFPLRGAVRCTCGALVTTANTGRTGYRYRNYVCRHVERHGGYPAHRADRVEADFLTLLKRLHTNPDLVARPRSVDAGALRSELAGLRRQSADLDDRRRRAWELADGGSITDAHLRERLDEVDADRARIAERIATAAHSLARANQTENERRSLQSILERSAMIWAAADTERRQDIARLISEIVGGLWLDPARKGVLLIPADVAKPHMSENMREINSLRDAQMAQRKADDGITKKFIQSISE